MLSRGPDESRAAAFVREFLPLGPEIAPRAILDTWRRLPVVTRAAIVADWSFWVRGKQRAPEGDWLTWGFLTGRGFGKTIAVSKFVNGEAMSGRAPLILLCAQDEDSAKDIQVLGPSGLVATSKPWERPTWEASALQLTWPNGARAYVRTPEVPGKIRGLEYCLAWISELQSWPNSTREEAFSNVFLSTRLGYSRVVWDSTPKRRHPLLKDLLAKHEADPRLHHIVRGTTHENAANLGPGYLAEMERLFAGTLRGREELFGEMLEDSELSIAKQAWIDARRRPMPETFARRVVSIDPAVSNRRGSDTTGIVEAALGTDGQGYVLKDKSGKHDPSVWGSLALDWYVSDACDLIIAETNKGGALVAQNLRALAKARGLEVIVVGKDERPQRQLGKVFVKEVFARGAKEERAEPVGTAYEKGRISHVIGADLASLEDTLTTWEPSPNADSPGDLDALVHAMIDLLDLAKNEPDAKKAFEGISSVGRQLLDPVAKASQTASVSMALSRLFGRNDRI